MPDATRRQQPQLLDEVRQVLRLHHYSVHTERSYVEWIVRFVRCDRMRSRQDLFPATPKIESFLTDLAVHGHVAVATQNADMSPILILSSWPHAFGGVASRHQVHGFGIERIFSQTGFGELDGVCAASVHRTVNQDFRVFCGWREICS